MRSLMAKEVTIRLLLYYVYASLRKRRAPTSADAAMRAECAPCRLIAMHVLRDHARLTSRDAQSADAMLKTTTMMFAATI